PAYCEHGLPSRAGSRRRRGLRPGLLLLHVPVVSPKGAARGVVAARHYRPRVRRPGRRAHDLAHPGARGPVHRCAGRAYRAHHAHRGLAGRAPREAAELRAVTSLARAAAHEINNPLMIGTGGLAILAKRLASGSEEARWAERAKEGAERIREIVGRMNEITEVREAPEQGMLPPMLDIRKSSEGASSPPR